MNNCFHLTRAAAAVAMIFTSSFLISGCGDKPQASEKSVISYSAVGSFASFSTNACLMDTSCVFAWKIDGDSAGSERSIAQTMRRPGSHSVSLTVTRDGKTVADLSETFIIDAAPESTEKALWNSSRSLKAGESDGSGVAHSVEPAAEDKSQSAPSEETGAGSSASQNAPEPAQPAWQPLSRQACQSRTCRRNRQ